MNSFVRYHNPDYKIYVNIFCKFQLIEDKGSSGSILDASNRFYTLIPHDFGMKKPPLLDNLELIKV